eukprot:1541443-Amphidinium_carterae.1
MPSVELRLIDASNKNVARRMSFQIRTCPNCSKGFTVVERFRSQSIAFCMRNSQRLLNFQNRLRQPSEQLQGSWGTGQNIVKMSTWIHVNSRLVEPRPTKNDRQITFNQINQEETNRHISTDNQTATVKLAQLAPSILRMACKSIELHVLKSKDNSHCQVQ